jgi:D-amino-acid dehydrogenase
MDKSVVSANAVVIVGAGIVGLAIAHRLVREGVEVAVVDRDPGGDKVSFGNAGGIGVTEVVPAAVPGLLWRLPGWLLDPLGPLSVRPAHAPRLLPWLWRFAQAASAGEVARVTSALAAINGRVYEDLPPLLADIGLSGALHRSGALTVYESEAGFRRDAAEWALKRSHGIEVENLTGAEARALEPALGAIVHCAAFTPQWSHVDDPKQLVDTLRAWLQAQGVAILTGAVSDIADAGALSVLLEDGRAIPAAKVVVAAGAWSGALVRRLGDRVLLESERGYNATLPDPGVALGREVIFAERKFVATPLNCGLRIGGAAEFGGLRAPANFGRSEALLRIASRYLPGLNMIGATNWAGHRPATPDSLPVIGASPRRPNVFYAFGHGHLGLTQAATTGRLIADLICGRPPQISLAPFAIGRFG